MHRAITVVLWLSRMELLRSYVNYTLSVDLKGLFTIYLITRAVELKSVRQNTGFGLRCCPLTGRMPKSPRRSRLQCLRSKIKGAQIRVPLFFLIRVFLNSGFSLFEFSSLRVFYLARRWPVTIMFSNSLRNHERSL